jgi:protein involved in polysaccharide export with SLBB domain
MRAVAPLLGPILIAALCGSAGAQTTRSVGQPTPAVESETPEIEAELSPRSLLPKEPLLDGPVDPATYLLGPGDVLGLTLQGTIQRFERLIVTPEGTVLIPGAGQVSVAGIPLEEARSLILAEVGRAFRNVRVTVTLVQLRRFVISVLGQVAQPGQYYASQVERVADAIQMAGGPIPGSSARLIHLTRRDGTKLHCDLLWFSRTGDLDANPNLSDGDIVMVDYHRHGILMNGDLFEPGEIEHIEGDSLGGLIRLAGGLRQSATLDTVEIARFLPGRVTPTWIYLTSNGSIDQRKILSTRIEPRDVVLIRTDPDWDIRFNVEIRGEVAYPGIYNIDEERTTLSDLVARAGGFTPEASLREATIDRLIDDTIKDPEYERLLLVPPADMTETEYEYFKMRGRQRLGRMAVDFVKLFRHGDRSQDILLKANDKINIPREKDYVTLSGQVAIPGNIGYRPGLKADDYIKRGGGYAWKAAKGRTVVIRATTGEWIKKGDVDEIGPGDTIWVPEKPDRDWYSYFKDSVVILSQVATIYLVIKTSTE